jgi:sugar lactone lactonase YvrE
MKTLKPKDIWRAVRSDDTGWTSNGICNLLSTRQFRRTLFAVLILLLVAGRAFAQGISLGDALNAPQLVWTTSGDFPWFVTTNITHDGVAAGGTGGLRGGIASTNTTTVAGPGLLSFYWEIDASASSNPNSAPGYFSLQVDGGSAALIGGTQAWQPAYVPLADGNHRLAWILNAAYHVQVFPGFINYIYDGGHAYLDQVTVTPPAPVIVVQPTNQTVIAGNTALVSVQAAGVPPLSYQWRFNDSPLEGATNATLVLSSVTTNQAGLYSVAVTNDYGGVVSSNALMMVLEVPPAIALQPADQTVWPGDTTTFSVKATGSPPFCYQWQFKDNPLDGATNATLVLSNVTTNQAGPYSVVVTNLFGSVTSSNAVLTVRIPYTFTTLAGLAGSQGSADGTGSAARFYYPWGVAVDSAGNVYVADTLNNTIRKVTPGGVVTTLAGLAGNAGSADRTGSAARFSGPDGVAVDSAGNVYVADTANNTIRKVTPGGVVTTLAGLAGNPGSADGTGSAARFNFPVGVAVDSTGNVYVADRDNDTIRKVTPGGVVTTPPWMDLFSPCGVAVDSAGNEYVADAGHHTIRKVTPGGVVTTLAGLNQYDVFGNPVGGSADGTGSAARFGLPFGVAVDSAGNVYVADLGNQTIRKVTPGGVVTTLAGLAGTFTYGSVDGTGSTVRFYGPVGVAVDSAGNVYVADTYNNTIRRGFAANGGTVIATSRPYFGFNSGQFGFNLAGPAGRVVVIDVSTDLTTWLPIWTNTIGAGALPFSDPQSNAYPNRFYRAVSP